MRDRVLTRLVVLPMFAPMHRRRIHSSRLRPPISISWPRR